ncbi:WhiB family transcriptional regulator [Streptomyces sp. G3]|uniref:WhiB family transcriptional regulator n=1 Tax=Streptomyces sp. G3 TaxID=690144 RepID=UPI00202EDEE4|nr:WhiB family transcriptional regulator [Streptomyces sp. G3]MCM1943184.1 WhiB family transcriptional regulator [Streptomyces sp. G3]
MIDLSHVLPAPKQWSKHAACASDPERMFPDNVEPRIRDAKAVCASCPVRMACLQDALRTGDNEYGIRGELKPGERRAVAKLLDGDYSNADRVAAAVHQVLHPASAVRPLREVFFKHTEQTPDGHLKWTGYSTFNWGGKVYAPKRTSFFLHRGREANGNVRRTPACPLIECVHPMHLEDGTEREQRVAAAREAKELLRQAKQAAA